MTNTNSIAWIATLFSCLAAFGASGGETRGEGELTPRTPHSKPTHSSVSEFQDPGILVLKLREGSGIALQSGQFAAQGEPVAELNALVERYGYLPEPKFSQTRQRLNELRERGQARTRRELEDLSLYFELFAETERAEARAAEFLDALNALGIVEVAYAAPIVVPSTPDFSIGQGYTLPAGTGIDSQWAHTQPGGRGDGVHVYAIEFSANFNHEDLQLDSSRLVSGVLDLSRPDYLSHGTAALGVLVARENGYGVTGIVPNAEPYFGSACRVDFNCNDNEVSVVQALLDVVDHVRHGHGVPAVVSMSIQTHAHMPLEWDPAMGAAIKQATSLGIHVVYSAGNGAWNLDLLQNSVGDPLFQADSGAIVVGAGCPPSSVDTDEPCNEARQAIIAPDWWGSNFGQRIDLQGWGTRVVTTGYGGLHDYGWDHKYTDNFFGTSAAAPIVAGAVASLLGMVKAHRGEGPPPPELIREILKQTGTPQPAGDAAQYPIGPMPDLYEAWQRLSYKWGSLSIDDAQTVEGQALTFRVSLAKPIDEPIEVGWSLRFDRTADEQDLPSLGNDFAYVGSIEFLPGQVEAFFQVPTCQDSAFEGTEQLTFQLSHAENASIMDAQAVATILDDEFQNFVDSNHIQHYGNKTAVQSIVDSTPIQHTGNSADDSGPDYGGAIRHGGHPGCH